MSNYLFELAVAHLALMVAYGLLLRKERHFAAMRFCLTGAAVAAVTIPLLKLPKLFSSETPVDPVPTEIISPHSIAIAPAASASAWSDDLWLGVYIAVSACMLFRFLNSTLYLVRLGRRSSPEKSGRLCIFRIPDLKGSFSFFSLIFLSDEIDKNQKTYDVMLEHEKAHASLGHTYDIIFLELFKACFWWLPTAWIASKEIRKIHEYQADAYVLRSYPVDQYSSILISATLKLNGLSLASSFHDGLISKRLTAMRQQTKKVGPLKVAALGAVCALLFTTLACTEAQEQRSKGTDGKGEIRAGEIFTVVEAMPEAEGGMETFYRYVMKAIKYPAEARGKRVEGRVDVQFVVEKDGSLSEVSVIKGIGAGCDSEAVRVIENSPSFRPAAQRGNPVRVRMMVPVTFKLDNAGTEKENGPRGIIIVEKVQPIYSKLEVRADYNMGEWSGIVFDEKGEGLPGANIVVSGTTTGTVSGPDGAFKIKADGSQELHLSFVGYETIRLEKK